MAKEYQAGSQEIRWAKILFPSKMHLVELVNLRDLHFMEAENKFGGELGEASIKEKNTPKCVFPLGSCKHAFQQMRM